MLLLLLLLQLPNRPRALLLKTANQHRKAKTPQLSRIQRTQRKQKIRRMQKNQRIKSKLSPKKTATQNDLAERPGLSPATEKVPPREPKESVKVPK